MCLYVRKSSVVEPIKTMECFKMLNYYGDGDRDGYGWVTPYQHCIVKQGHGWFVPKRPSWRSRHEFGQQEAIYAGFIHAYTSKDRFDMAGVFRKVYDSLPVRPKTGKSYMFRAIARDVVAQGALMDKDLVCKALYIPAFDITGQHKDARFA